MVKCGRVLRHLFTPPWAWRRAFPRATLDAIEAAIAASERHHGGEIRFAVEPALGLGQIWRGLNGRARAVEVFAQLRVWDTEHNSGVLIYLLLADRDIEIVADRGVAARVPQSDWDAVARAMEARFRQGDHMGGGLAGIERVGALLTQHFPPPRHNPDELANRPVIVRT